MATIEKRRVQEPIPIIPVNHEFANKTTSVDFDDEENLLHFVRKNRWVSIDFGPMRVFRFNWVVTLTTAVVLWGFIIAVLASNVENGNVALDEFTKWQSWITQNFTWLYIVTQDVWVFFLIWLYFSKYANLKLGKENDKPEFDNLTWFSMLFACGIGVGLYFFGVSEPLLYYRGSQKNILYKPGFLDDDGRAQQSLFITFYHWGIHGWVVYIIVALLLGIVSYRWNMPMTLRSAFFPLLGNRIYGFAGDFVDALSMSCTTFGVCTSLGFGVKAINSGIYRVGNNEVPEDTLSTELAIIWVITSVATLSVLSGLHYGIKMLSQITFVLGLVLIVLLLLQDNTWYLLNVYIQSLGYYAQHLFQVSFETDAFQQASIEYVRDGNLLWGSGPEKLLSSLESVVGENGVANPVDFYNQRSPGWIHSWTIFYWGWWISWAPFVGMFIAMISKGRTIKQVIAGTVFAPILFSFFWLSILGSLGIKMERSVELALNASDVDVTSGSVSCEKLGYINNEPVQGLAVGLAEVGHYALACRSTNDRIYDIMEPYGENMGVFMKLLVVVGVALYFITSSDSGSYVDDTLAAGGMQRAPAIQKAFWCLTEGACACALIVGGGSDALAALQAVSVCAGLPYTIAICFMCVALVRACQFDSGDKTLLSKTLFNTGLFDFTEGLAPADAACTAPSVWVRLQSLVLALFLPFYEIYEPLRYLFSANVGSLHSLVCFTLFITWIVLLILQISAESLPALAWVFYIAFASHVSWVRMRTRQIYNIHGSIIQDFIAVMFMYPFAISQMAIQHSSVKPPTSNADGKSNDIIQLHLSDCRTDTFKSE